MARKNSDEPKFSKRGVVRISLDEYYKKDWLKCDIGSHIKRRDSKLKNDTIYKDGDECPRKDCTGILKYII